ncbi:MAG: agmatinase [Deltaproteobacteria bacterium]|jgi:agmatinase|nr:agmatinase [Deltaproteobacteria bacterium]
MMSQYTFAGLPECGEIAVLSADIAIIGVPHGISYSVGVPSHSVNAPMAIRKATKRYSEMIDHYDYDLGGTLLDNSDIRVFDCGDVPGDPSDPIGNQRRSQEKIRAIINAGAVPIVLGGDDSITIPFLRAFQGKGVFTVVQVDAHIDWRHEVNGITEGPSSSMRRASEMPWIDKLIQAGMRGVGSARIEEIDAARDYGAEIITAKNIQDGGIDEILSLVTEGSTCLLTIDCDGLDPSIMSAVNAPMPGGLSYRQVVDLLHGLTKKANVCGFNLVEFVPEKDINGLAALTAARISFNMIGALVRSAFFAQNRI